MVGEEAVEVALAVAVDEEVGETHELAMEFLGEALVAELERDRDSGPRYGSWERETCLVAKDHQWEDHEGLGDREDAMVLVQVRWSVVVEVLDTASSVLAWEG